MVKFYVLHPQQHYTYRSNSIPSGQGVQSLTQPQTTHSIHFLLTRLIITDFVPTHSDNNSSATIQRKHKNASRLDNSSSSPLLAVETKYKHV